MLLLRLIGRPCLASKALAEALVEVLVVGDVLCLLRRAQLLHGLAHFLGEARVSLLVVQGHGAVRVTARCDPPVQAEDAGSLHLLVLVSGRLDLANLLAQCYTHELEPADDLLNVLHAW